MYIDATNRNCAAYRSRVKTIFWTTLEQEFNIHNLTTLKVLMLFKRC